MSKFKVSKSSGQTFYWSNLSFLLLLCPVMSTLVKYWRLCPGTWLSRVPELSFQERPEEREIRRWDSKQLSENACVSYDLIPPLAHAHSHAHSCTHAHTSTLSPSLSPPAPPSPNQVRSFDRVHSLPVPLSAPHPGRNQTHHTFLCCRPLPQFPPSPLRYIPAQQEFTCTGLRRGGRAPPSMNYSSALGSGTPQNTACRLRGKKL